jgi:hypothetical protein
VDPLLDLNGHRNGRPTQKHGEQSQNRDATLLEMLTVVLAALERL